MSANSLTFARSSAPQNFEELRAKLPSFLHFAHVTVAESWSAASGLWLGPVIIRKFWRGGWYGETCVGRRRGHVCERGLWWVGSLLMSSDEWMGPHHAAAFSSRNEYYLLLNNNKYKLWKPFWGAIKFFIALVGSWENFVGKYFDWFSFLAD